MTIHIPRWLLNTILVLVLLSGGAAAGASTAQYFWPRRAHTAHLNRALAELGLTKRLVAHRERPFNRLMRPLPYTDRATRSTLSRPQGSEPARRSLEQAAEEQSGLLITKERDVYVLRTCLIGVAVTLNNVLDNEYRRATANIQRVERECRAAKHLLE
jgi:hypothetical protein